MFTRIVVPLDGSPLAEAALEPAAALARRVDADIELIVVTSPGVETLEHELMLKEAGGALDGVMFTTTVIESNDLSASIVAAADGDDRLLCMATHGRTGLVRAVLGSTADAVLRTVAHPVLLVGPRAATPTSWDVIQVCVDPSSPESRRAIPAAVAMARTLGGRLWLTEAEPALGLLQLDVVETAGLAAIATTLHRDGVEVEWEVLHGADVVDELLRTSDAIGASILVTTADAPALGHRALGHVTAALVHGARCPVLVVPPARVT